MESEAVNDFISEISAIQKDLAGVEKEFEKHIVGNQKILGYIMKALLSGGHVLLEGAPGLGKTLMIKTVAKILDLKFRRVQFKTSKVMMSLN